MSKLSKFTFRVVVNAVLQIEILKIRSIQVTEVKGFLSVIGYVYRQTITFDFHSRSRSEEVGRPARQISAAATKGIQAHAQRLRLAGGGEREGRMASLHRPEQFSAGAY